MQRVGGKTVGKSRISIGGIAMLSLREKRRRQVREREQAL